jgi:hypothetical protein
LHYYYQNKVWTIKLSSKSIKPKSKIVSLLEIENHNQNATFGLGPNTNNGRGNFISSST